MVLYTPGAVDHPTFQVAGLKKSVWLLEEMIPKES